MSSSNTSLFLGHHLEAHGFYDVEASAIILHFIEKCPRDIILILRLYQVELGETIVGEIIFQLFILHKNNENNHDLLVDSSDLHLP